MGDEGTEKSGVVYDDVYDAVVERLTRAVVGIEATLLRHFATDPGITSVDQLLQSSPRDVIQHDTEVHHQDEEEDNNKTTGEDVLSSMTEATRARVERKLRQLREECGVDLLRISSSSSSSTTQATHQVDEVNKTRDEAEEDVLLWSQEAQQDTKAAGNSSHAVHSPAHSGNISNDADEAAKQEAWLKELEQFYRVYRRHGGALQAMQHDAHALLERGEAQWRENNRLPIALQKWLTYDPRYTPASDAEEELTKVWHRAGHGDEKEEGAREMRLQDLYDLSRRNSQRYESLCTRWADVKRAYVAVVQEMNQRMCQAALQLEQLEEREEKKKGEA